MPLKISEYGKFKSIDVDLPPYIKSIVTACKNAGDGSYIAGGAVRSLYEEETPRDIDIFSRNVDAFLATKEVLSNLGYVPEFENPMVARYNKYNDAKVFEYSVDLVVPRVDKYICTVGPPETVVAHFDFTVARATITCPAKALIDVDFEQDCKAKCLKIKHVVCPLSTVQRIGKYAKKGYTIGTKEILKLFIEYKKRDMDELEQLFEKGTLTEQELTQLLHYVYVD